MKACCIFFTIFIHSLFSVCTTVSKESSDITDLDAAETCKSELPSLFISAGLNDIIVLSAPIINNIKTIYYISNPKGDATKLNISSSKITTDNQTSQKTNNNHNVTEYEGKAKIPLNTATVNEGKAKILANTATINEGKVKIITANTKPRRISLNHENYENSCFVANNDYEKQPYDFTIGPLNEDDYGNWVLSAYYKDSNGDWIELYQVITIDIVETLQTYAPKIKLVSGQTFEPRFRYAIKNLESCQITAPRTAFDRFYDRDRLNMDFCGFRIPNVTKHDQGVWKILAVGKITYKGEIYLQIDDEHIL